MLSDPSTWVALYGDYLYTYALTRIQDISVAQDLVQDTFMAGLKSKDTFKGRSSEKTWFTSIIRHKIIDFIRKKYRQPTLETDHAGDIDTNEYFHSNGTWKDPPKDWLSNPAKILEQKSFLEILQKCVKDLPQKLGHALTMRELEGVTTKEICKVLDISSTNCWTILHRARMLVRKCIETNWFETKGNKR
jgi:RNA polymerase sigma-70 factor (TIGR02943 family)